MNGVWTSDAVLALAARPGVGAGRQGLATAEVGDARPGRRARVGRVPGEREGPVPARRSICPSPPSSAVAPAASSPASIRWRLLLFAGNDAAMKQADPPPWAAEWLAGRASAPRARRRRPPPTPPRPTPPPPPSARRAREKKTAAGMAELGTWLGDVVRQGLAAAQAKPYDFWHTMAARLVDARRRGRPASCEAGGVASAGDGWQGRLLDRLGKLHLLVRAYGRLDALSPERRADVRSSAGPSTRTNSPPNPPSPTSGRSSPSARSWMTTSAPAHMAERARAAGGALFLQFAHGATAFEQQLLPGTRFRGEIAYYPGHSMRHALRGRADVRPADAIPTTTIDDALAAYAAARRRTRGSRRSPSPCATCCSSATPTTGSCATPPAKRCRSSPASPPAGASSPSAAGEASTCTASGTGTRSRPCRARAGAEAALLVAWRSGEREGGSRRVGVGGWSRRDTEPSD